MAAANDFLNTLNANFKEVYADNIKDIIPDGVILYNTFPFIDKGRQPGKLF